MNIAAHISSRRAEISLAARALRLPSPAWGWEHLRRNPLYHRDYYANAGGRVSPITLNTGCVLLRENRRWRDAEKWGLLTFEDPAKPAPMANVFWKPSLLAGSLSVQLHKIGADSDELGEDQDEIILSHIPTRRVILETVGTTRHLLMNGNRFWIHLHCNNPTSLTDKARIGVQIEGMKHFKRRLDTAAQLLSLYQSSGKGLSLIGRHKNSRRLADGLIAYDIIASGGTHKDVAIALEGEEIVRRDWNQSGAYLRDTTRRLIARARYLVNEGYRGFLTQKNL